jgi:hypothetical protein
LSRLRAQATGRFVLTTSQTQAEPPLSTFDTIAALLPHVLMIAFFVLFVRVMRRFRTRSDESLGLSRDILAELRAIRTALERADAEK